MKKHVLIFAILLLTAFLAKAQSKSAAFNNGDNLFNAGLGLGTPFFGAGYSASLPINPTVSFERGITDAISIGGIVSYASSKFDYTGFGADYSFKESAIYIGGRGSYHLGELLDIDSKFDLYGGASLGYVVVTVSDNTGDSASAASGFGLGAFAGGKYYFKPALGIYAEVGYQSLSYLNVGLAFKF